MSSSDPKETVTADNNNNNNDDENQSQHSNVSVDNASTHDSSSPLSRSSSSARNSKRYKHNENGYRQRIASWIQHESDKDLYIRSLTESLLIHKEIVERIENEKEQYVESIEQMRRKERQEYEALQQAMEERQLEYEKLQQMYHAVLGDLEKKKQEYQRMEANYYSHVRQIRATDDDLSTIQTEISHLFSQISNLCMSLRSKADRAQGTAFVFERWPEKQEAIRTHLLKSAAEEEENEELLLDPGHIGVFTEKFLVEELLRNILEAPLHVGVSVNEAFRQVEAWMAQRNAEWAARFRQQMSALVAKQPGDDEEENIEQAKQTLTQRVMEQLLRIYPKIQGDANAGRKVTNVIQRATRLSLAIKGQELPVRTLEIEEGATEFDPSTMKPASKGKPEGLVLLVITPAFTANDPTDPEHGFLVPAKVFCV